MPSPTKTPRKATGANQADHMGTCAQDRAGRAQAFWVSLRCVKDVSNSLRHKVHEPGSTLVWFGVLEDLILNGAVLYATKYGSTARYANWIGEATGLPVQNVRNEDVDPSAYDFLILATPVIYYKLLITDWVQRNLTKLEDKPIVMVTVSGAPPGPKLDAWVGDSLPADFVAHAKHVALRGRQIPAELTWYDRAMLIIAAWRNPDPVASEEELKGFDYMDKASIGPVVALANELTSRSPAATQTEIMR